MLAAHAFNENQLLAALPVKGYKRLLPELEFIAFALATLFASSAKATSMSFSSGHQVMPKYFAERMNWLRSMVGKMNGHHRVGVAMPATGAITLTGNPVIFIVHCPNIKPKVPLLESRKPGWLRQYLDKKWQSLRLS